MQKYKMINMKRNTSIITKLIVPASIVFAIIIISMMFVMRGLRDKNIKSQTQIKAKGIVDSFNAVVDELKNDALHIAASFATKENVVTAYKIYGQNESRHFLRTSLSPEIQYYKKISEINEDLKLHFHTKDLKSLWKSWRKYGDKDGGEDLSKYRHSIKEVVETNRANRTIELDEEGLEIAVIAPIMQNGEYLGSVESDFNIEIAINKLRLLENENISVLVKTSDINFPENFKNKQVIGDYTLISQKNETSVNDQLIKGLGEYKNEDLKYIQAGGYAYYLFPIYQKEKSNVVAVALYSFDLSPITKEVTILQRGILFFVLFSFIAIFLVIFIVSRTTITKPIKLITQDLNKIAEGNLLHKMQYDKNDEIGFLAKKLSATFEKVSGVFISVNNAYGNLRRASEHLNYTSQDVSQGASEQAASVEQVSASMEQMSANIEQNVENAKKTEKEVYIAAAAVYEGNKVVQRTTELMKLIAEKIVIINQIAKQTNILALNASVESASAGEFGKGFSVIAKEIRQLAEDSHSAALEIEKSTKSGVISAEKAGNQLADIVKQMENSSEMIKQIVVASKEQQNGVNQVTSGIEQLNKITQQNAAVAEEMATSSEQLAGQSESLAESISSYLFSGKTADDDNNNDSDKDDNEIEVFNDRVYNETKLISDDSIVPDKNPGFTIDLGRESINSDDDFERF